MDFSHNDKTKALLEKLDNFIAEHIAPIENEVYDFHHKENNHGDWKNWKLHPGTEALKAKAREAGLANLFLPDAELGQGLTTLEYAPMAERMGKYLFAPEIFNCNAPDTGNMEVLARYGNPEQQANWLAPLMRGEIRSAFCMTEPDVASSDATNIETSIVRNGDEYVINGRKWWSSGACNKHCTIYIVMGKTDPQNENRYIQQSMILVPIDTPGVTVTRPMQVFGYDDAPHGHAEVLLEDVRVPVSNVLGNEGDGFAIAQERLGPGRIHHCMRWLGIASRAFDMMCERALSRESHGKIIAEHQMVQEKIADSYTQILQYRLHVLYTAWLIDKYKEYNREVRKEIAAIKAAPTMQSARVPGNCNKVHPSSRWFW